MAFGQASGPPASAKEIARLADLLQQAGYTSFKEARHPIGLTQRQAAGKFTRDEVTELMARLESEADGESPAQAADQTLEEIPVATGSRSKPRAERRRQEQRLAVAGLPDDLMASELELRGWTCIPPL